jgi:IS30 family transposase
MNKRARRRLPRNAAILSMTEPDFRKIIDMLKATPRKYLEYRTPAEMFRENLSNPE